MGLFNEVDVTLPCPRCGKEVKKFQTKDDTYDTLYMEKVDFWTVREFHSICDTCNSFVRVKLGKDKLKFLTLSDYTISFD
jgi:hypothetical protein